MFNDTPANVNLRSAILNKDLIDNNKKEVSSTTKKDTGKKHGISEWLPLILAQMKNRTFGDDGKNNSSGDIASLMMSADTNYKLELIHQAVTQKQGTINPNYMLLDKNGIIEGNTLHVATNTKSLPLTFDAKSGSQVLIQIFDKKGEIVHNIEEKTVSDGLQTYDLDLSKYQLKEGEYKFKIAAINQDGSQLQPKTYEHAKIQQIYNNGTFLIKGHGMVQQDKIIGASEFISTLS